MTGGLFRILENRPLNRDMILLRLGGDSSGFTNPGQFADIRVPGKFLRRPISVCDWREGELTLVYRVLGAGTAALREMKPGAELDLLIGLGNGYNLGKAGPAPILLGGGSGIPPLLGLCRRLMAGGAKPRVLLGYRTADDAYLAGDFEALGAEVLISTGDGSLGVRGMVTDLMAGLEYSFFYACGPEPMYRSVAKAAKAPGQYSFEARMGCGFGACMGCSCETLAGTKRICRDGPVMESGEIKWEN